MSQKSANSHFHFRETARWAILFTAPLVHLSICVIISDCRHLHAARPTQHHRGADGEQAWQHGSAAHGGVCNAGWTNGGDQDEWQ
jgi:hypothetical protein